LLTKTELFDKSWTGLHDAILHSANISCTREQAEHIFDELPAEIQNAALERGMQDTEFKEQVYAWILSGHSKLVCLPATGKYLDSMNAFSHFGALPRN